MQICPTHQIPMNLLFTSSYCPLCSKEIPEVQELKFEDLSPAQQRVWLATDIISQIVKKQITPDIGSFVELEQDSESTLCQVCALGALVVSSLPKCFPYGNKTNILKEIERLEGEDARVKIHEILAPFFNSVQLDLIEASFECISHYAIHADSIQVQQAILLYRKANSEEERLILIMENIIKNQGEFIVSQESKDNSQDFLR